MYRVTGINYTSYWSLRTSNRRDGTFPQSAAAFQSNFTPESHHVVCTYVTYLIMSTYPSRTGLRVRVSQEWHQTPLTTQVSYMYTQTRNTNSWNWTSGRSHHSSSAFVRIPDHPGTARSDRPGAHTCKTWRSGMSGFRSHFGQAYWAP